MPIIGDHHSLNIVKCWLDSWTMMRGTYVPGKSLRSWMYLCILSCSSMSEMASSPPLSWRSWRCTCLASIGTLFNVEHVYCLEWTDSQRIYQLHCCMWSCWKLELMMWAGRFRWVIFTKLQYCNSIIVLYHLPQIPIICFSIIMLCTQHLHLPGNRPQNGRHYFTLTQDPIPPPGTLITTMMTCVSSGNGTTMHLFTDAGMMRTAYDLPCTKYAPSSQLTSTTDSGHNGRKRKMPMATLLSQSSTVFISYNDDCSMTQGSPLPTSCLSFHLALTPASMICQSKFHRRPIH